jgi:hypothetical protein
MKLYLERNFEARIRLLGGRLSVEGPGADSTRESMEWIKKHERISDREIYESLPERYQGYWWVELEDDEQHLAPGA